MYKIVRESEGTIRQVADNKTATNIITKDISPELSLAITDATDYYEKEMTPYNRVYYILEGKVELNFDGESSILSKGDSCFIGEGTIYEMRGTFKAIVVNQPAFGSLA